MSFKLVLWGLETLTNFLGFVSKQQQLILKLLLFEPTLKAAMDLGATS